MATIAYSSMAFADDLTGVVKASRTVHTVRACLLTRRGRDQALRMLRDVVTACEQPLCRFTVVGRWRYIPDKLRWETVGSGAPDAAELLRCASQLRGGVVVLEDCAAFLRDEGGDPRARMALWQMLSSETVSEGLVLVFVEPPEAESRLPSILADQFVRLDVPYPRAEELALTAHRGTRSPGGGAHPG